MHGESLTGKKNPGGRAGRAGAIRQKQAGTKHNRDLRASQSETGSAALLGGDAFTRDRLKWLEAVIAEPRLAATAVRLAGLISLRYMNRARGIAWPSILTICRDLRVEKKAVLRAIEQLEDAGLFQVSRSRGRGRANEYTLTMPPEKGVADGTFSDDGKCPSDDTFSDTVKCPVSGTKKVSETGPQPFDRNPLKGARRSRAAAPVLVDDQISASSVANEGTGAFERAPAFSHDGVDDLDPDAVEALAHLGKPVTLAELDRLAASDPGTDHLASPDPAAGDEPWHDDNDDLEAIGWDDAVDRLAALHGPRLSDPLAFIEAAVFGFIEGDRAAAREAVAATVDALRGIARPDDRDPLWWSHRTVLAGVFAGEDHRSAAAALADFERDTRDHFAAQHQPKARETTA